MTAKRLLLLLALTLAAGSSTAFAATLNVGSWHLWAGAQSLTKGTCTLSGSTQTVDTWTNQLSTSQSNGGATTLSLFPFNGFMRYAYVRFDISSCNIPATGGADSATLSLRITGAPSSSRTIDVTPVTESWDESLTWALGNLLSLGGGATASFATGTTSNVTKTVTVTVDVERQIKTGSVFGWRLSDGGGASFALTTLGSSENTTAADRPVLTINYEK
jgi:hypothetical protein